MLQVKNISTGYKKKQVLFEVSLDVNKNEIVLLIGSNGSGKSTLLKAMYGLLPLWNQGLIFFNGENITGQPTAKLLKKGLLYIPQQHNLFENLTVKENLEMAGLTLKTKLLNHRMEQALSIFTPLVPYLNKTPMKLSGGERKLLTLAMVTLHQPKMILFDEPFNGLSPKNIGIVMENLKTLNQKRDATLLIVEHRVKESLKIANRIVGLKHGKIFSKTDVNEKIYYDRFELGFCLKK